MSHHKRKPILFTSLLVMFSLTPGYITNTAAVYAQGAASEVSRRFKAKGSTTPVRLKPDEFKGAITVSFNLVPTSMSLDLPWNCCIVSENGIKVSNLAAETYDPRDFDGTGARASFKPGMDAEGRYVRAWIEHQSDARIVVRVRYAFSNDLYEIAHADIYNGSPYGKDLVIWVKMKTDDKASFTIAPNC